MIAMFTAIAVGLRRRLDNIATPCSMKAIGAYRRPPHPDLEVTESDLKFFTSSAFRRKAKSDGNLFALRLTACRS
jgi:hypothetical protein